ncbi:hypothetical protein Clacol_000970 [Clathrus columnatus]|uniref:Myb/SANT-like domain-containing protein n=1 Tax=Clathrus columnatus TaxID=1419009 RepID=A0AAV5A210_9AGAM|nr:hypothetical protein Clacol_000970 [Clathrus columnatus]
MVTSVPPEKTNKDKETKDKISWTTAQEATLVGVLLEQMKQGNQAESGWKPIVWTVVVSALEREHPSSIHKQATHCKSQWQRLKGEYKQVKELHGQSGFGWDASKQTVTAEPEVWQSYIQAHPKLAKWRTKAFPLFDDIAMIIGEVVATGQHVFHAKSTKPASPETSDNDEDDPSISSVTFEDMPAKTPKRRSPSTIESQSSHKCQKQVTGVDAIMSVSGAVESLAAALLAPDLSGSIPQLELSPLR